MNTHVRGQNLTYSIAHHIGIAIVTGVYSADNPIPIEAELCRQYGASRPALREAREAMRKLIQEAMDLICKREAQERRAGIRTLRADRP